MFESPTAHKALFLALGVLASLAGVLSASAQTVPTCTPTTLTDLDAAAVRAGSSIPNPASGASTVTANLFVPAGACVRASFTTYRLPGDGYSLQPYSQQKWFDTETANFAGGAAGATYPITLDLPGGSGSCTVTSGCMQVRLLSRTVNADGSVTYRWTLTSTCKQALSNVAFTMPQGVVASAFNARGTSGRSYQVENGTWDGQTRVWSIKFNTIGEGIAKGQSETFTYTLPAGAASGPVGIRPKWATNTADLTVDPATCAGAGAWQADLYFGDAQLNLTDAGHASNTLIWFRYRLAGGDGDGRMGPSRAAADLPVLAAAPAGAGPNYPNPFAGRTTIPVALEQTGPARLEVFDLTGRLVATPLDGTLPAGTHAVGFDAAGLTPGVYVYRLTAGEGTRTGRMTVAR